MVGPNEEAVRKPEAGGVVSPPPVVPLGIKPPTEPVLPITIRKCQKDCCVVQPHSKRFTIITFPDRTEVVTSYGMAVESVRSYINRHTIMEPTA